jgi:hypothetical protein
MIGDIVASPLVVVSQDRDGGHGALDLPQLAFGQIDLYRSDILLLALDLTAARNRNDPRLLSKQSDERNLRWCRLLHPHGQAIKSFSRRLSTMDAPAL